MAFIVETGSGTPGANAYCAETFVTGYLAERGRSTEGGWDALTSDERKAKVIAATAYIDARFGLMFKGRKAMRAIAGREASGILAFSGLPSNTQTVVVGLTTYRFVTVLAQENDVLIGADVDECYENLIRAIEASGSYADVSFDGLTQPNYEASAAIDEDSGDLLVYARTEGISGNLIAFSTTVTGATATGSGFLSGGLDSTEQPLSFPRVGLYSRAGVQVLSVPMKVKMATAEYAVRAASVSLMPDPTTDASGQPVISKSTTVGEISKSVQYASPFAVPSPFPAADRLLDEFVLSSGGTYR